MRNATHRQSVDLAALGNAFDAIALLAVDEGAVDGTCAVTTAMRGALRATGFHSYAVQPPGLDAAVIRPVSIITEDGVTPSTAVLYRAPGHEQGDALLRLGEAWTRVATEGELWALCLFEVDGMVVVPLTKGGSRDISPVVRVAIDGFAPHRSGSSHAPELLAKFREIAARGPLRSSIKGDTAVGLAVQAALGIDPTSSSRPDFLGAIEVTAGRVRPGSASRRTIFSKTPDWGATAYPDRNAVLHTFGVPSERHGGRNRLFNTLSATSTNSHGLQLQVDHDADVLHAVHLASGVIAMTWPMESLRASLQAKHNETFWVSCDAAQEGDGERFDLVKVVHTVDPRVWALGPLIDEGLITLDTTIGENPDGSSRDHGWLFRMRTPDVPRLIPVVGEYSL